jgi:hypothetical protein
MFVSFDLMLQPDVFIHQLLISALAFLQIVEFVSSAPFLLLLVVAALVRLPLEDTH